MNTRTEQDNDISLYSLAELQAMKGKHEASPKSWHPFKLAEVLAEIENKTPKAEPVKKGDSITIIAKRWFDSRAGNTYFSAIALVNGVQVASIPFEYGYDRHYEDQIFKLLYKLGYCSDRETYNNGSSEAFWVYCDRKGITKYVTHSDVTRKKDL